MDKNKYNDIIRNIEKEEKYVIKKGMLYRIKGDRLLRVIRKYEFEGLMYMSIIMSYQHILELKQHKIK
jgi:hypothetical protein